MARNEAVVYGVRAALAVAEARPQAILRVFHDQKRRQVLGPLLSATAAVRRPYREVPGADLDKLAKSKHHEGVVVVTEPLPLASLDALTPPQPGDTVLALDEVGNPHNLGAIIRSAAWFGARGLVTPTSPRQAALSAAAIRVAQGGAERLSVAGTDAMPAALKALKRAGYTILGADQGAARSALDGVTGPVVFVLGNETDGLDPASRAACDDLVAIPGTGVVESLNVSVSAGILLATRYAR